MRQRLNACLLFIRNFDKHLNVLLHTINIYCHHTIERDNLHFLRYVMRHKQVEEL